MQEKGSRAFSPMHKESSSVVSEKAAKYMTMLGKHFARKVTVEFTETQAKVDFPWGKAVMEAIDNRLNFNCEADSEESLAKVKGVINDHIYLLKEVRGQALDWQAV